MWLLAFFSRLIGCSNAVPFETASCWRLVHCPCAVIQYQEQAGDKGTGVRQCCDARASSQLWKLCTVETLLIYTAGCLTGKGIIMQQHLGVQHLDEAACIGILGAQLWASGFENLSQDAENTWENTGILYHHPDLPFQWLRQLDTNCISLLLDILEDTRPLGQWKKGKKQIQFWFWVLRLDLWHHNKSSPLLLPLWWVVLAVLGDGKIQSEWCRKAQQWNGHHIITSSLLKPQNDKADISMWARVHVHDLCLCSFSSVSRFPVHALQESWVPPVTSVHLNSWDASSEACVLWSWFLHGWWPFVWDFQMFQLLIVWKSGGILPKAVVLAGLKCLLHV